MTYTPYWRQPTKLNDNEVWSKSRERVYITLVNKFEFEFYEQLNKPATSNSPGHICTSGK